MRILRCVLILLSFALCATAAQEPPERVRGIALFRQNDIAGAVKLLKAAVKRNPDDGEAWYFLGLAFNRKEDFKAARKAFENAAKALPRFAPAHSAYAYTLLATNRTSDAADEARRALELDPDNPEAHYVLGAAYLREGNAAMARREADLAVKLKSVFPFAYLLQYQALLSAYAQRAAARRTNSGSSGNQTESNKPPATNPKRSEVFESAANALATYLKQRPEDNSPMWREQLDTLQVFAGASSEPMVSSRDVEIKARVLSKPEPQYTNSARDAGISGTVILQAVFTRAEPWNTF